jgi:2-hydroxychromene-2-carboxylate isomerase
MANLKLVKREVSYTLELTEKEANYLELVLRKTRVRTSEGDQVWNVLDTAGIDGDAFFAVEGEGLTVRDK